MTIRNAARLVAVVLALALAASACADDEATDEPASAGTETDADDATPADVEEPPEEDQASTGDDGESPDDDTPAEPAAAEQPEASEDDAPEGDAPEDDTPAITAPAAPRRIAYLSASSANTFLLASVGEMQRLANENNIELVEFDAQFLADLQTTQLQDVVASGQYDGIILVALNGPGLVPRGGGP